MPHSSDSVVGSPVVVVVPAAAPPPTSATADATTSVSPVTTPNALAPYRRIRLGVPQWVRRAAPRRAPIALFVAPDGWKALVFASITVAGLALGDGLVSALAERDGYCGGASASPAAAEPQPTLASYGCVRFFGAVRVLWLCCPLVVLALGVAAVSDPGFVPHPPEGTAAVDDAEPEIELAPCHGNASVRPRGVAPSVVPKNECLSDRSASDAAAEGGDGSPSRAVGALRPVHPQSPYVPIDAPTASGGTTGGSYRLVHCRYCGIGVQLFDHHCVVLGICVGRSNMGAFVLATALYTVWLSAALWACALGLCILYGSATPLGNNGAVLPAIWGLAVAASTSVVGAIANGMRTFSFSGAASGALATAGEVAAFLFDLRAAFVGVALFVAYMWLFCGFLTLHFLSAVCGGTDTVEGRRKRSQEGVDGSQRHRRADARVLMRRLRTLGRSLVETRLATL